MISMKLEGVKAQFFDRKAVTNATDKAARKVLSKFGAFVRRGAKSSIKKGKGISQPGNPPKAHTGLVGKNIFFIYEPKEKTVVIGPILINKPSERALELLEHGGTITRRLRNNKTVQARYRARPFMRPAFDKEKPNAVELWRNAVK